MLAQATPTPARSPNLQQPLLTDQSLVIAVISTFALTGLAFVLIAIVVRQHPQLVDQVVSADTLHMITVMPVLLATVSLAVEGIFTGEAAASILSGIVGYVLGSLKGKK